MPLLQTHSQGVAGDHPLYFQHLAVGGPSLRSSSHYIRFASVSWTYLGTQLHSMYYGVPGLGTLLLYHLVTRVHCVGQSRTRSSWLERTNQPNTQHKYDVGLHIWPPSPPPPTRYYQPPGQRTSPPFSSRPRRSILSGTAFPCGRSAYFCSRSCDPVLRPQNAGNSPRAAYISVSRRLQRVFQLASDDVVTNHRSQVTPTRVSFMPAVSFQDDADRRR